MRYTTKATANISAKIPTVSPILIARFRAGFVFFDLDFNRATNQLGLSSLSSPLGGSPSQKAASLSLVDFSNSRQRRGTSVDSDRQLL